MKNNAFPYCTVLLALVTLVASFYVAVDISGSLFGKIRIIQLEKYGGVTLDHLQNFELWRLFVSQIIHVKQFHMVFNVLTLLLLGAFVERHIGFGKFFVLWFVPGAAGTLFSTFFVESPWNLGSGGSQAIMGVAAFGFLLMYRGVDRSIGLKYALAFAVLPALALDLIFSNHPKPGHVLGFVSGIALGFYFLRQKN